MSDTTVMWGTMIGEYDYLTLCVMYWFAVCSFLCCATPPVLDEATSALSETNEQHMYSTLKMLGITYMSIGHRSSLKQV